MDEDEKKKEIEIVSGNGDNLDISPVYGYIQAVKPKCNKKPKNIVIPKKKEDDDKEKK